MVRWDLLVAGLVALVGALVFLSIVAQEILAVERAREQAEQRRAAKRAAEERRHQAEAA
ncbi:MAG TPA: hypothetical protein VGM03_04015 [Phycisphaerae bacterium]